MTRQRPPLTRADICAAALTIIDRDGLGACTMRAVASEVGVEAMSLYWHVARKDDLLDGVIEIVLADLGDDRVTAPAAGPVAEWRAGAVHFATTFRARMSAHPNVLPLLAARPVTSYMAAKRGAVAGLHRLMAAGLDEAHAVDLTRLLVRYVFGSVMLEASAPRTPEDAGAETSEPELAALVASVAGDESERLFALGLETFLSGAEHTHLVPAVGTG